MGLTWGDRAEALMMDQCQHERRDFQEVNSGLALPFCLDCGKQLALFTGDAAKHWPREET